MPATAPDRPAGRLSLWRRFARLRKAVAIASLAATASAFTASGGFDLLRLAITYAEPQTIAEFRLRHTSRQAYIAAIEAAVHEEDFDDARRMVRLAGESGHSLPPDLVTATEPGAAAEAWHTGRDFLYGAATGDVSSMAALGGTLAADYLVIGDIRDVALQGSRLVRGEDYDGLILGLAAFGLVTLAPGSGPLDLGASLIKTAARTGRLSAPLRRTLTRLSTDLIDTGAARRIWRGTPTIDPATAKRTLAPVIRPKAAAELGAIARNAGELVQAGGVKTAMRSLATIDNAATDLPRLTKFARRMGDDSATVLRLFGKGAIRLGKLAYALAAAILAVIGWCFGLVWTVVSTLRDLRQLFGR